MTGPARFRFLNVEAEIGQASQWNSLDRSALWVYNAHYFDDLNATGAEVRTAWHLQLIDRWIRENPLGQGVGWDPYPTSLRMVNWIKWDFVTAMLSAHARDCLATQARWLRRRLEYHILGNHLLANLKALIFAGLYFSGREAEAWYVDATRRLAGQINEQVLADGGHFERSPMYHAIVLEDVLDIINLHRVYGASVPSLWQATARDMLSWLELMTHPDGEITFFNDAAIGIAANLAALQGYASRLGVPVPERRSGRLVHLQESGYVRINAGPATTFLDLAPIGPDYLPGHAHADTLSFELSLAGERVFVNSGTSTYQAGPARDLQRGTSAHNTVVIDGENSSEVWAGFRVARRARVFDVSVREAEDHILVTAAHDGYRRLSGRVIHRRTWRVYDSRMSIEDSVEGVGQHDLQVLFHLHPACRAVSQGERVLITTGSGQTVTLGSRTPGITVSLEESCYRPEFGMEQRSQVITVSLAAPLPASIGTSISWQAESRESC